MDSQIKYINQISCVKTSDSSPSASSKCQRKNCLYVPTKNQVSNQQQQMLENQINFQLPNNDWLKKYVPEQHEGCVIKLLQFMGKDHAFYNFIISIYLSNYSFYTKCSRQQSKINQMKRQMQEMNSNYEKKVQDINKQNDIALLKKSQQIKTLNQKIQTFKNSNMQHIAQQKSRTEFLHNQKQSQQPSSIQLKQYHQLDTPMLKQYWDMKKLLITMKSAEKRMKSAEKRLKSAEKRHLQTINIRSDENTKLTEKCQKLAEKCQQFQAQKLVNQQRKRYMSRHKNQGIVADYSSTILDPNNPYIHS